VTHSLAFPFLGHCSGDYGVLLPISESMLSCICFLHTSKKNTLVILFLGGELAFLLLYTLLKIHALAILLQKVSWPGF